MLQHRRSMRTMVLVFLSRAILIEVIGRGSYRVDGTKFLNIIKVTSDDTSLGS